MSPNLPYLFAGVLAFWLAVAGYALGLRRRRRRTEKRLSELASRLRELDGAQN